ncbi:type I polyketide synthase, partial [Raphidocelis subcapitata]
PGQANYAAANAGLDGAAAALSAGGVAAVSVQWGAWAGAGMAASDPQTAARVARLGLGLIGPAAGLAALEKALQPLRGSAQARSPSQIAAVPFVWPLFLQQQARQAPSGAPPAVFGEFAAAADSRSAGTEAKSATGRGGTAAGLGAAVSAAVSEVLGSAVAPDAPLMAAGLDSLGAVELRNALEGRLGVALPATLIFDYPTVSAIQDYISARLGSSISVTGDAGDPGGAAGGPAAAVAAPSRRVPRSVPDMAPTQRTSSALAVVSAAARLPCAPCDASSGAAAWPAAAPRLAPRDAVRRVPHVRWDADRASAAANDLLPAHGAFVAGAAAFDAAAFGLSPGEAALMDPQQRLLLVCAAEALSGGGALGSARLGSGSVPAAAAAGGFLASCGAYVGISSRDYFTLGIQAKQAAAAHSATATTLSVASGRLAFAFGLRGPAVSVDTACSSSLVAAHAAASALALGQCGGALVGGANLCLSPDTPAMFNRAGMLAPDGRCKTLDAAADGYVRAEAVGVLLLQALAAGGAAAAATAPPLALLAGSAVNQDGRSSGLTAPNGPAQQERPDVAYSLVAVDFLPGGEVQSALRAVAAGAARGALRPLPLVGHGLSGVAAALRQMSQANHVGKVVTTSPTARFGAQTLAPCPAAPAVLITGGTGALGLLTAAWLAGQGVRRLHLISRTGRAAASSALLAARLADGGAAVTLSAADASCASDGAALAARDVGAVVHAAGVLEDAALPRQSLGGLRRVWASKAAPIEAWRASLLRHQPLGAVVLFSSVAALLGSAGQANYATANAALDGAAAAEQRGGVAAVSIQWGAWADVGMAAGSELVARKVAALGMSMLSPADGLAALERLLCCPALPGGGGGGSPARALALPPPVAPAVPFVWGRLFSGAAAAAGLPRLFEDLRREHAATAVTPVAAAAAWPAPRGAAVARPAPAAPLSAEGALAGVREAVAAVLGREVAPDAPLMAAGLDSLGAVELRNALEARLRLPLPATLVFDFPTPAAIAGLLAQRAAAAGAAAPASAAPRAAGTGSALPDQMPEHAPDHSVPSVHEVQQQVEDAVASVLGRPIAADAPLMASGLDSLGAVELRNALEARLRLPLPATLAFDHPTPAALAVFLCDRLGASAAADAAAVATRVRAPPAALLAAGGAARSRAVAVVAIASRVPGCDDGDWRRGAPAGGAAAADAIRRVPSARWSPEDHAQLADSAAPVRFGSWLPGVAAFDAAAFGIRAPEAALMDPQQRLLLEAFWEAAASGGRGLPAAAGDGARWGVYVGISALDYSKLGARLKIPLTAYSATGGLSLSVAAGRLAFTFGLRGPALAIDTACSSSLVAAHSAAAAVVEGAACEAAAAAGVNLALIPDTPAMFQRAGMLAPDGRCKTLDAAADGYVRAEAVGMLLLQALAAGGAVAAPAAAPPLALLAGSAVNQDGRSSGLTAPNGPAQQEVLRAALAAAGLGAGEVCGLQLHGTGTGLGDPIEVGAAAAVFGGGSGGGVGADGTPPLLLAASKSWAGHAEPAAGVVGLLAAACQGRGREVAPIAHLRSLNPLVALALEGGAIGGRGWSLARQSGGAASHDPQAATRCGVSAFAFQGTNANVILEAGGRLMLAGAAALAPPQPPTQWRRARFWPLPPASALVRSASVAAAAGGRPVVATLQARLGAPALAYLWDHRVAGRAVLPAAAFLDFAAASSRALLAPAAAAAAAAADADADGGAAPAAAALAAGTISQALPLPRREAAPELACELEAHTGALRVLSLPVGGDEKDRLARGGPPPRLHFEARAAPVPPHEAARSAGAGAAESTHGLARRLARLLALWNGGGGAPGAVAAAVPAATAQIEASANGEGPSLTHPARLDAALQLGAVPLHAAAAPVLRVPAGFGLFVAQAGADDGCGAGRDAATGWACAARASGGAASAGADGVQAGALLDYSLVQDRGAPASPPGCSIAGLLARPLSGRAAAAATAEAESADAAAEADGDRSAASDLLYDLAWAVSEADPSQGADFRGSGAPGAAACRLQLRRRGRAPTEATAAGLAAVQAAAPLRPAAVAAQAALPLGFDGPAGRAAPRTGGLGGLQLAGALQSAALELPATAFTRASVATQRGGPTLKICQHLQQPAAAPAVAGGPYGTATSGGVLLQPQLLRSRAPLTAGAAGEALQLVPSPRGAFSNLVPAAVDVSAPLAPGRVLLSVRAVGLNFRDVLNVLGMYPGDPGAPGGDCAGVVVAAGSGSGLG